MAHEAFALSPISARAASPTDADFEAIRDAFVETARGRWFLDEYTKRNRNADTAMVLEAVARIERSLTAQKEEQQRLVAVSEPPPEAASDEPPLNPLPEAMATVKAILTAARDSASAALADPAIEEALAPSRKCARVIREIAWGLRESGADGRICALLESQVTAINVACDQIAAGGFRDGVLHAFDQAALDIENIVPSAEEHLAEIVAAAETGVVVDFRPASEATPSALIREEIAEANVAFAAPPPEAITETVLSAEEDSVVEFVTVSAEADVPSEPIMPVHLALVPDEPEIIEASHQPVAEIAPKPIASTPASTLGESLIANGIVARPASSRSDPLAAIRRMTQAEKIAFFS
ncbi:hypothetical protein BH10PSE10_BH10PSE10_15290 [soil metagenome]